MKKVLFIVTAVAVVAWGGMAVAAQSTTDVVVNANVVGTCKFNTPPEINFVDLDPSSTSDAQETATLEFWCTNGVSYTLADETNDTVGDGTFNGTLTGPGSIPYQITYDSTTGAGAGKNAPMSSTLTATITNADFVDAPAGNYTDTVTFTINH